MALWTSYWAYKVWFIAYKSEQEPHNLFIKQNIHIYKSELDHWTNELILYAKRAISQGWEEPFLLLN